MMLMNHAKDSHEIVNPAASPSYGRLTPLMCLQLAAPHTWPAAILPVLLSVSCSAANGYPISVSMAVVLLAICILMQSSVNTFNDYFDYVKGSDSATDNVDPTDAVLVYNKVNPKSALALAIGFLAAAFCLGVFVIVQAGWVPLALGIIGAIVVVFYSAGNTPISYLPIGEAVSGFVMGGIIPLACYQALAGVFEPLVLVWSLPVMIGIGLIMLTNNTCDIEKDLYSERKTLAVILGRSKARLLYHICLAVWIVLIIVNVVVFYREGTLILVFMLTAAIPLLKALFSNPLTPPSRIGAMAQICSVNICLGAFYAAAVLAQSSLSLVI